jgi:hypothetical protein
MTDGSKSWEPPDDYVRPSTGPVAAPCRKNQTVRDVLGPTFPRIVCLCGSTRFKDAYENATLAEALMGRIILSVDWYSHSDERFRPNLDEKQRLDELHLRKIELADEVLVLNVGGYIGESTGNELAYAMALGRPVRTLEPLDLEAWRAERNRGMKAIAKRNAE